jgi:hypothetical protein
LFDGTDALRLEAEASALTDALEIATQGSQGTAVALLRPIRWKLLNLPARPSLHEAREAGALPPGAHLLGLQSPTLGELQRELRRLGEALGNAYERLGWPRARVSYTLARSKAELMASLELMASSRKEILHLAGHAGPDGLELDGEHIDAHELAKALGDSQVRLLVINGCSAASPRSPLAKGVISLVDALVRWGRVPEVVAHRTELRDDEATAFAERFYGEFLSALDLGRAVYEARRSGGEALRLSPVAISQRPARS